VRFASAAGIVALAVAADQASKYAVEQNLPFHQAVDVLPFLALFRTYNEGIAFSMLHFAGDAWLIGLTLAILALVGYFWTRTDPGQTLARAGLALVVGGAVGNLIDRIVHGHVIDFVLLHAGDWSFAVFNLADSFITIGAGLVVLGEFADRQNEEKQQHGK
jgi:signal peptidase II